MLQGNILLATQDSVFNHPGVDGVMLEFAWADLEPEFGSFNFSLIDSALEKISPRKQIVLNIVCGSSTPDFVAPRIEAGRDFLPVTWTSSYLRGQQRLWTALGKHLEAQESRISAIVATFVSSGIYELGYQPEGDADYQDQLEEFDYSPVAMLAAWTECSKAASFAFPAATFLIPVLSTEKESFPPVGDLGQSLGGTPMPLVHRIVAQATAYYPGRVMVLWDDKGQDKMLSMLIPYEHMGAAIGVYAAEGMDMPEQAVASFIKDEHLV